MGQKAAEKAGSAYDTETLDQLQAKYAKRPRARVAVALADALVAVGDYAGADSILEEAVQTWPDDAGLLVHYARFDHAGLGYEAAADHIQHRLVQRPHHSGLRARAAMVALAQADEAGLIEHASRALKHINPEAAARLRRYLAGRVMEAGLWSTADRVLDLGWAPGASPHERLFESLQLRIGRSVGDEDFEPELERLALAPGMRPRAGLLLSEYRWRRDGPSWALAEALEAAHALDVAAPATAAGIAYILGGLEAADAVLSRRPELAELWPRWLVLARLMAERGLTEAQPLADLFDHVQTESNALERRLGDKNVSVAVVGNSPGELGQGRGVAIDRHREVIRFNHFSTAPRFQPDFGSRTTVVCRLDFDLPADEDDSAVIHLTRSRQLYGRADWTRPLALRRQGARITTHPWAGYGDLRRHVGESPSSGIMICDLLQRLRGALDRDDFFGFSFVGQTDAATSHYTGKGVAGRKHKWDRELTYFNSLFG